MPVRRSLIGAVRNGRIRADLAGTPKSLAVELIAK